MALLMACALGAALPVARPAPEDHCSRACDRGGPLQRKEEADKGETKAETKAECFAIKSHQTGALILPAKPGGDIDMNGRLLAKDLGAKLGRTVVPVTMDGGRGTRPSDVGRGSSRRISVCVL